MRLREESCGNVINNVWNERGSTISKIKNCASRLKSWSKDTFGSFAKEIRDCKSQMKDLMEDDQTNEVIAQMRHLDARMDELEAREELYWHQSQRSRQNWLKGGDKNTSFFHAKDDQRRDRNNIDAIKDEAGNLRTKEEYITGVFVSF